LQENEGGPHHEDKEDGSKIYNIEKEGLTLICIAGIKDIIRQEVPGAVQDCNEAGVRVRMSHVITRSQLSLLLRRLDSSGMERRMRSAAAWRDQSFVIMSEDSST